MQFLVVSVIQTHTRMVPIYHHKPQVAVGCRGLSTVWTSIDPIKSKFLPEPVELYGSANLYIYGP